MQSLEDLAQQTIVCPKCGADPGQSCHTSSGQKSSRRHSGRTRPIYDAWRVGFEEGMTDAVEAVERLAVSNVDAKASAAAALLRRRL